MRPRCISVGAERKGRVSDHPRLTDELLHQIERSKTPEAFLSSGAGSERDLPGYLNAKLEEKGLRRADVVREAGLNETFGYQIFTGQRGASRDKVLALGFALKLDLHDMRLLLNQAGAADLYSKNRRDAIVIFCVSHGLTLAQADEELYLFGEKTIGDV